jgi:hypothetical protein
VWRSRTWACRALAIAVVALLSIYDEGSTRISRIHRINRIVRERGYVNLKLNYEEVAEFDEVGVWSVGDVRFSKHGTLVRTCEVLVSESERGWLVSELESRLGVRVGDALRKLVREGRIAREDAGGRALYVSADGQQRRRQLRRRATASEEPAVSSAAVQGDDELMAAIVLFCALRDEKQRRLFAGLESLKLGAGGDRRIADLLGLDPATVRRGRQELLSRDFEKNRVRKPGGGRKRVEKKRRK